MTEHPLSPGWPLLTLRAAGGLMFGYGYFAMLRRWVRRHGARGAEVQLHVASMEELLRIIGAMRSLAGMHLHEATRALEGVRQYGDAMAEAVREALLMALDEQPMDKESVAMAAVKRVRSGRAIVLCASEHGFVGAFNERLLQSVAPAPNDLLLVLGSRAASLANERGYVIGWQHPMATRPAGISEVARQAQLQVFRLIARGQVCQAEVIFPRLQPSGASAIERSRLFPLDVSVRAPAAARPAPLHTLTPAVLLEKLTSEYLLARLAEATAESIASENAARFAAMSAAHDNVSRKLEQLQRAAAEARQEEITSELNDLITGQLAIGS
jgi:F-type H+-transporting ATPase subunit gamma